MGQRRPSLRGKILLFYGATLASVIALELLAQNAAAGAGSRYQHLLERYHAIQGTRTALADFRSLAERYMRERMPDQKLALDAALDDMLIQAAGIPALADEGSDAYFDARAAQRGFAAWIPAARKALDLRAGGRGDAYAAYLEADSTAGYIDAYLGRVLSLSLAEGAADYKEQSRASAEYRRLALWGIIGAGALAFIFAWLFATSVSAPIRRLAHSVELIASGKLDVESVVARSGDEVEVLANGFNAMAASIRSMVEGLEEKAALARLLHEETLSRALMGKALREAQFLNLQDRLRPHFLFNALNTIARSAMFEEAGETERLALSLGRLMRYALAEDHGFATVGEELASLREYLSFQEIRFGPRLRWRIEEGPGVSGAAVPRLTLQPIVENAVRHGIEADEEGGTVLVSAKTRGGRIRLLVADSGAGMGVEALARLRMAMAGELPPVDAEGGAALSERRGGIGMANLASRLEFRYPGEARISVVSRAGKGTIVKITIPDSGGETVYAD